MPIDHDRDKVALGNHRAKVAAQLAADKAFTSRTDVTCALCSGPIRPGRDLRAAWMEVTGYVVPREAGGANQIKLKEHTGRLIHEECGRVASAGPVSEQAPMW